MMTRKKIRFIDLFAGIGGTRIGFEKASREQGVACECVFTSEIDKYACQVYRKNFPNDTHNPENDITKFSETDIPDFDVLLAGFPCQAFSVAGRQGGFEDTRGTLFFDIARILKAKLPDAFLLENVKGLAGHKRGKTLEIIMSVLHTDLGYKSASYKVLNSKNFGLAQNRERVYIVGFRDAGGGFEFPDSNNGAQLSIKDIIEEKPVSVKYYLSTRYLKALKNHKKRHLAKGHGFGYVIREPNEVAGAIVIGGMGKERNLVMDKRLRDYKPVTNIKGRVNRKGVRRMTPLEWERLQGFPDNYTSGVSDTQRYKQLANAVSVPVIKAISKSIVRELLKTTKEAT